MLFAIALVAVAVATVIVGALVASDSAHGTAADGWMLNGPHSLH
jgi:hypothetical protein